ncbi:hypothetical protein AAG570_004317 [Ranatra chinensis]|uniref:Secreted protein n=1 Tax=Ranatra chinensis TaxID=642074 RepID=A0ABD0YIR4_9HEMI
MKVCAALVAVLCAAALVRADTVNLNAAVDELLVGLRSVIIAKGEDQLTIPNLDYDWHFKVHHFLSVHCYFNCDGGWARRLSSVKRTGDVTMTTSGNRMTLRFSLGLGDLTAHFDTCRLKAHRIGSASSKVEMHTSDTSIEAQITLVHNGNRCDVSVDKIDVRDLGHMKFDTGGGVFHKVEDKILEALSRHFNDKVKAILNQKLLAEAKASVSKVNLCAKIPF